MADGGYNSKFGAVVEVGKVPPIPKPDPVDEVSPPPSLPPIEDVASASEEPALDSLPPIDEGNKTEDTPSPLPRISESADSLEDTPAVPADLPPSPSFGESDESADELPAPSFGDDSSHRGHLNYHPFRLLRRFC